MVVIGAASDHVGRDVAGERRDHAGDRKDPREGRILDTLTWTLNGGVIYYGKFLTAIVNFLIVAATLLVVTQRRSRRCAEAAHAHIDGTPAGREELTKLSSPPEIRDLLGEQRA